MGTMLLKDILVDTRGSCFLCSKNILYPSEKYYFSSTPKPNLTSFPVHSLQCLSRHLKLDLGDLLALSQQHPIAEISRSQLKVSLCGKCANLNEKFSKLYRQLEKIEMEVTQCLELVNESLQGAIKAIEGGMTSKSFRKTADKSEDEWIRKIQILNVLRKDAQQKCAEKIATAAPRIRLRRIKKSQMERESPRNSIPSGRISNNKRHVNLDPSFDNPSVPNILISNIKTEVSKSEISYYESNNYGNADMDNSMLDHLNEECSVPEEEKWQAQMQSESEIAAASIKREPSNNAKRNCSLRKKPMTNSQGKIREMPYVTLTTPLSKADSGKPKHIRDPVTRKYLCNLCPTKLPDSHHFKTEYTKSGIRAHYRSIHLKEIVKCTLCNMEFSSLPQFHRHYQNFHLGIFFSCLRCKANFTQKVHLTRHIRKKSCSGSPPIPKPVVSHCPICGKGFTVRTTIHKHMKDIHSELRNFGCDTCGRKFKRKNHLTDHRRRIHPSLID